MVQLEGKACGFEAGRGCANLTQRDFKRRAAADFLLQGDAAVCQESPASVSAATTGRSGSGVNLEGRARAQGK